ncbi:MAG: hypothetical protein EA409_08145 [Saprospirales bacterium]|nr:MAG: hypothetical protein EA409_08145 [Saprospirales bacterium]
MAIPIILNFRGIILVTIIFTGLGIYMVNLHSKAKETYDKSTGIIEYFAKEYQNLPSRHKGDFRYLKINSYPYLFEIYEPNSEPTEMSIDDLKIGDKIDIYFYETYNTKNIGLNRFAQFIDKDGQPFFVRSGFQMHLGLTIITLAIVLQIMAFAFWWNSGKLQWSGKCNGHSPSYSKFAPP